MKKKRKKRARCPACKTEKYKTEMEIALAAMEALDRQQYPKYQELGMDPYRSFLNSDFSWACDECLRTKRAIPGIPGLQQYSWNPHYAYFDTDKTCGHCGVAFVFSKEEKKYWYEDLKFWVDSEPANCTECRRTIRQYKMENRTLSEILKKAHRDLTTPELEKVIEIYQKWQLESKVKFYQSILRKRIHHPPK